MRGVHLKRKKNRKASLYCQSRELISTERDFASKLLDVCSTFNTSIFFSRYDNIDVELQTVGRKPSLSTF